MILFGPKSARSAPADPGAGGEKGRRLAAPPTVNPVVDEKATNPWLRRPSVTGVGLPWSTVVPSLYFWFPLMFSLLFVLPPLPHCRGSRAGGLIKEKDFSMSGSSTQQALGGVWTGLCERRCPPSMHRVRHGSHHPRRERGRELPGKQGIRVGAHVWVTQNTARRVWAGGLQRTAAIWGLCGPGFILSTAIG